MKFYRPGTQLSGQNERSTPVVMQYAGEHISVVWPSNIKTQEPGPAAAGVVDLRHAVKMLAVEGLSKRFGGIPGRKPGLLRGPPGRNFGAHRSERLGQEHDI